MRNLEAISGAYGSYHPCGRGKSVRRSALHRCLGHNVARRVILNT